MDKLLETLDSHSGGTTNPLFSPHDQRIMTYDNKGTVRLWNSDGKFIADLSDRAYQSRVAPHFSPDDQLITLRPTEPFDGRLWLWDANGKLIAILGNKRDTPVAPIFSPDSQHIVTMPNGQMLQMWDRKGTLVFTMAGDLQIRQGLLEAAFSQDGRWFAFSDGQKSQLWDAAGKRALFDGQGIDGTFLAFSHDSRRLLTAGKDGIVRMWDVDGKLVATLSRHSREVTVAAWSHDDRRIITGAQDGTLWLWDSQGKPLIQLSSSVSEITSVEFSSNDLYLLGVSGDGTALLWSTDGKSGASSISNAANKAQFSSDGSYVIVTSRTGGTTEFPVRLEDVLALAACRVARGLTPDEIKTFNVPEPLSFDFAKRQCPAKLP